MVNEIYRLEVMIEDLRRLRKECEPKRQENPRYHAYSSAVSSLKKLVESLRQEQDGP